VDEKTTSGERFFALLAYVGPLVVIPLLMRSRKRFLRYHARQGMYLFGVFVAALILTLALLFLFKGPVAQEFVFLFLSVVLLLEFILYVATSLFLAYRAAQGSMPMIPVLGDMAGEQ
jgi:uncharacterized membrane protein